MTLRVLLIGSAAEDLLFLQDVLREIEQERLLPQWPQIEPLFAATCAEAERILSTSQPHAIFLDLAASEGQGPGDHTSGDHSSDDRGGPPLLQAFRVAQARAPEVPVILLLDADGEALAARLMREGAEDFLLKSQVDCAPVAHVLGNAVVRHRLLSAARAGALTDPLTGLANRAAFLAMAERDRKLAERLDRRWMLLVAEPRNLTAIAAAFGDHRRDLELVEAAEQLRSIVSPADLLARLDDRRFAMSIFDGEAETAEEAWVRIRSEAAEARLDVGVSIVDPSCPLSLDAMVERALADLPAPHPKRAGAA